MLGASRSRASGRGGSGDHADVQRAFRAQVNPSPRLSGCSTGRAAPRRASSAARAQTPARAPGATTSAGDEGGAFRAGGDVGAAAGSVGGRYRSLHRACSAAGLRYPAGLRNRGYVLLDSLHAAWRDPVCVRGQSALRGNGFEVSFPPPAPRPGGGAAAQVAVRDPARSVARASHLPVGWSRRSTRSSRPVVRTADLRARRAASGGFGSRGRTGSRAAAGVDLAVAEWRAIWRR